MTGITAQYAEFRRKHAPKPVHGVWREVLAEFAGTFILIFFGCCSVAQAVLSYPGDRRDEIELQREDILSINLGFALGAMMAIFLAGETSGAHLNPAITLPMVVMGRLPAWKFPYYVTAQLLGAFFGALGVYTVYNDAIMYRQPHHHPFGDMNTAGIFATYPGPHLGRFNGFVEQVCATSVLSMLVLAITDRKNMGIPKNVDDAAQPPLTISKRFLEALSISLLVLAIGVSQHHNSGYAINPARDLGPRLFTFCAYWGMEVFTGPTSMGATGTGTKFNYYWFWIPVVGPMVGGLLGAAVYHLFIGLHLSEPRPGGREPSVVEAISDDQAQPGEAAEVVDDLNPDGAKIP